MYKSAHMHRAWENLRVAFYIDYNANSARLGGFTYINAWQELCRLARIVEQNEI